MDNINPNLIIASNLYRLSALISAIAYFVVKPRPGILEEVLTLVLIIGVAHLIRKGYKWVKWVMLIIEIIFLPFYIISIFTVKFPIALELVGAAINLLQLVALVHVFLPYKEPEYNDSES